MDTDGSHRIPAEGRFKSTRLGAFRLEDLRRRHQPAGPDGSVAEWVIADGLDWGRAQLDEWMEQLLVAAGELASPALVTYLEGRRRALEAEWKGMEASRVALRRMAAAMG